MFVVTILLFILYLHIFFQNMVRPKYDHGMTNHSNFVIIESC